MAMASSGSHTIGVNVGEQCFALQVEGPSMEPRFRHGDTIVVDTETEPRAGDFVVVAIDGEPAAAFKQLAIVDGKRWLHPLNPQYPAAPMPEHASIVGVVVQRVESFR